MALLRSVTLNTTPGLEFVNFPPGILSDGIVCVKREGIQYDQVSISDLNNGGVRQWCLSGSGLFSLIVRIRFPESIPFNAGEKVFVIYKPIV